MASPIIKLKRSSVQGKIPTSENVPLGELALNTYDGYLYASKNVGVGTTVIAVNPWRVGTGTDSYDIDFTAGNVGINSASPTALLDVNGDANISGVITATEFHGDGSNVTGISTLNITDYGVGLGGGGGDTVTINATATDILSVSSGDISADDAGADKLVFWDDSESKLTYLTAGSGLSISGTTITASGGGGSSIDALEVMLFT